MGTIVETIERGDVYIYRNVFSIQDGVDIDRYCEALERVVLLNAVLRSRIIDSSHGLVQVVLRENHHVLRSSESIAEYLHQDRDRRMALGTSLFRSAVVEDQLVLTIHHAVYDFSAILTLLNDVSDVYHDRTPAGHAPFKSFVEYQQKIDPQQAKTFWTTRFEGFAAHFPTIDPQHPPLATHRKATAVSLKALGQELSIAQLPSFIEAAWALVSSIYTGSKVIAFGFVMSGRVPHLRDVATTLGPTTTTIPVQVHVRPDMTIAEFVTARAKERRQVTTSSALQWGLTNIRGSSEEARVASNFQTVINIRPAASAVDTTEVKCKSVDQGHGPYGICLWFTLMHDQILVEADYDPSVVPHQHMERVLHQFRHVLEFLTTASRSHTLSSLPPLSPEDKHQLLEWNANVPEVIQGSIHSAFADRAQGQPDDVAVDAWDGSATYRALDDMSTKLAVELRRRGLLSGDAVILLFERSLWAIVAALGILKAGACCVPVAVTHPRARKETLVSATNAKFVLTSQSEYVHSANLATQVLVVDHASISALPPVDDTLPCVDCEQLAYIIFTSGSTGLPKGAMLEHRSLLTSLTNLARQVGWARSSRTLQFASLVWDASLLDIWGALLFGGCVCIPSDADRESSLATYIDSHQVNWALLTPTVLRTISPSEVPSLQTVVSGGEAVGPSAAKLWGDRARFFNAWGVSEASIVSAITELGPGSAFPESIGRPVSCALWIVEPSDVNKLVPIGTTGELVIESPCVARGYLNEEAKTAASFLPAPSWAPERRGQRRDLQRFYRTGDLARYYPDGSVCFIGRQDSQVKLRSQRFELNEVDTAILSHNNVREAVSSLQKTSTDQKCLIAVLCLAGPQFSGGSALQELSPEQQRQADPILYDVQNHVKSTLPSYMVPSLWIVVHDMPRAISTKIDQKAISRWLDEKDLSLARFGPANDVNTPLSPPTTDSEKALQSVWAAVLSVPMEIIGRESSFLSLGGDSITVRQLFAETSIRLLTVGSGYASCHTTTKAWLENDRSDVVEKL